MKVAAFLYLFIIVGVKLYAQQQISGIVTDDRSQPVFAANIYWKNHPQLGVTSNFSGEFTIQTPNQEPKFLIISFIGYKTKTINWQQVQQQKPLIVQLESENQQLNTITIVAKDPISQKFSVLKMEKMDVYLNPVASGDPLKAITFLPSSTNTDEMANPAIRGSEADKSKVILNGVPVIKPVRNSQINGMGNFSLFNTEIIHKQYVYASNPPLSYGNTSAGLVEIETVRSIEENLFQLSTSLANTGFLTSRKLKKKSLFQAYGNWQFSDAFLKLNAKSLNKIKSFTSKDAGINTKLNINKNISFNNFSYVIDEEYKVEDDLFAYKGESVSENLRFISINNLNYKTKKGLITINTGWDVSKSTYQFGNLFSKSKNRNLYLSANYKQTLNKKTQLQVGVKEEYKYFQFRDSIPDYYFALSPQAKNKFISTNISQHNPEAYAFLSHHLSEKFLISTGIRTNIPTKNQKYYLSSQLSFKYSWNKANSILISGGKYNSYNTPNYYLQKFILNSSYQFAVDYNLNLKNSRYQAAIYYKKEHGNWRNATYFNFTDSKITGAEISWNQFIGRYWQFSFSNTLLKQKFRSNENWYKGQQELNYFIKASLSFNHPNWFNLNASFITRPGLKYTSVRNALYVEPANAWQPIFNTELNNSQYDSYSNLSINISRIISTGKFSAIVFASATNLLNKKNQSSKFYSNNYSSSGFNYYNQRIFYFGIIWQIKGK